MNRTVGCLWLMTVAAWLVGASVSPIGITGQTPLRSGWMAGVARVNITPREPIFMKGYGSRTKPSEGVRQDLYVKVLALRDETGADAVLVTSDLHSYTRRMSDTIAEAAQKKYGLSRDRLILNASHTHSGPAVTGEVLLRPSEDINPEQEVVIRRNTARVLDQIIDLIGRAIQNSVEPFKTSNRRNSRSRRGRRASGSTVGEWEPACVTCRGQ